MIAEHGYDTKYAMHCARLGFQCIELLETGKMNLPIEGDPGEWLRDVRYGKVPFDEWWDMVLSLDSSLDMFAQRTDIRPGPDTERIEEFSMLVHQDWWSREPDFSKIDMP